MARGPSIRHVPEKAAAVGPKVLGQRRPEFGVRSPTVYADDLGTTFIYAVALGLLLLCWQVSRLSGRLLPDIPARPGWLPIWPGHPLLWACDLSRPIDSLEFLH